MNLRNEAERLISLCNKYEGGDAVAKVVDALTDFRAWAMGAESFTKIADAILNMTVWAENPIKSDLEGTTFMVPSTVFNHAMLANSIGMTRPYTTLMLGAMELESMV